MTSRAPFPVLPPDLRAEARRGRRRITYGENGRRIGESHQKAILSDHEVELLLALRAEGYSLRWLAAKFEVAFETARSICSGRTRAQFVAKVRVA